MSGSEDHREIVAALLWDVPTLRRGSQSASDFVDGLVGRSERWWESRGPGADPLGMAANAVAHERARELAAAAGIYEQLCAEPDPWVRLFGLMLRAWSEGEEGIAPIIEAERVLESLDPGDAHLTAHLWAKLATYAFDEGDGELGVSLLERASLSAPAQSLLKRALAVEGLNVGLGLTWQESDVEPAPDALVEYPWIDVDVQRAAQATLSAIVEARARRVWTFQWAMGRTPIDDIVSAEVQATWAGALWMRRPIRQQLGAQLLAGEARNSRQWAYGVVMWALGGGKDPDRAYALAEPMLDGDSADFIIGVLADSEISSRFAHRLLSTAVEAWDELSEGMLRRVVGMYKPSDQEHPTMQEVRRLWAGYAARMNQEWLADYLKLDMSTRASLLEAIAARAAEHFSPPAKAAVFEAGAWALQKADTIDPQLLRVMSAVAPDSLGDPNLRQQISAKASAATISRLAGDGRPELFTPKAVERARQSLIEAVKSQSDKALQGTVYFGAGDPRLDLGRLIAAYGDDTGDGIALLMETALDKRLPAEHLFYARNGLALVRRAGALNDTYLTSLHQAPDPPGEFPGHGGISPELIKVSRLRILATDLDAEEIGSVVELCRAPEGKVRSTALAACAEGVETVSEGSAKDALSWSLVAGLFDQDDDTIASVVQAFTKEFLGRFPIAGQVALSRFPRLLDVGGMSVRAAVRRMAKEWASDEMLAASPTVSELLSRSEADRSWLVRKE